MTFEAYKIAVKISLNNQVSTGLLAISNQMRKTGLDAEKLQLSLHRIKLLGMTGMAIGGAGFMGLGIIGKMVKPASEYAHQLQQMNLAGMRHLEIVRATTAAWDAAKVAPTTSISQNLAAIRELRMVFGNTGHAIENVATVQKIQAILQNMRGGRAGDEGYTLAKALELKGAVRTPGEFITQADMMMKAMSAAGGKVVGTDFLSAFKYGRTATAGWSDVFTYTILPTLIQEMKGGGGNGGQGGPGNALMSAFSEIVGGTISQKALGVWQRLGMIDMSKAVWTTTHHLKGLKPGGIKGATLFQSNPFEWTQQFLIPALQHAGYKTAEQQREALQYLFPNRTAGFVMTQMATQAWKFQRDQKLIAQAQGLAGYDTLLKNDPEMASLALHKQWQSLLAILGFQIMPPLLQGTIWLVDHLRSMARWAKENATLVKGLVIGFAALAGAMAISGTLLVVTAGFRAIGTVLTFASLGGVAGLARIAGTFATMAGALVMMAPTLLALASAGYVGYKGGGYINRGISWGLTKLRGRDSSLGTAIYDWTHPHGGSSFVATGHAPVVQVNHTSILDGRAIAESVTRHQSNALSGPARSASNFDITRAAPFVGTPLFGTP